MSARHNPFAEQKLHPKAIGSPVIEVDARRKGPRLATVLARAWEGYKFDSATKWAWSAKSASPDSGRQGAS